MRTRARLVGGTTYGKGVIQGVFGLSDGGALVETVASYATPSQEEINLKGLEQLAEKGQTRFIADALRFLVRSGALTGGRPLDEVLDGLARLLDGPQGLDAIAGQDEGLPGDYVRPRAVEVGAAINRLRGMTAQQLAG